MDQEQPRARLETAIQSADHLLARFAETPYTLSDGEWLKLIVAQARELVRTASDHLDSDQARQRAAHT
jgi:hypothetical protein